MSRSASVGVQEVPCDQIKKLKQSQFTTHEWLSPVRVQQKHVVTPYWYLTTIGILRSWVRLTYETPIIMKPTHTCALRQSPLMLLLINKIEDTFNTKAGKKTNSTNEFEDLQCQTFYVKLRKIIESVPAMKCSRKWIESPCSARSAPWTTLVTSPIELMLRATSWPTHQYPEIVIYVLSKQSYTQPPQRTKNSRTTTPTKT